jgi:hypothetical protein
MKEIRILSATGILGSGFREETLKRAMTLKPDFIGSDCGSTDPGPHHLGSGEPQFSDAACKRDLRLMIMAARAAKIPVLVGSAMAPMPRLIASPASPAKSRMKKNSISNWRPSSPSRTGLT